MDERLKKYCDLTKFFMSNVNSVGEALDEARKTQEYLIDLITIQNEMNRTYHRKKKQLELLVAKTRREVQTKREAIGNKTTERAIDDHTLTVLKRRDATTPTQLNQFEILEREVDEIGFDLTTCQELKMAMFQRKDVITEFMNYIRSNKEIDTCLMRNKEFMRRVLGEINE